MPRPRKPPRLYQRPGTGEWIIRDGGRDIWAGARTERGSRPPEPALDALGRYLAARADADQTPRTPDRLTVGEALRSYAIERGPQLAAPRTLGYAIRALAPYWGDLPCAAIRGATCRRYAATRPSPSTARRELGVLQAAVNHAWREGRLTQPLRVSLPTGAAPRERWLTRAELRAVLRVAPAGLRRLILISVMTGTRLGATVALRWQPAIASGWVDLERGVLHRRGAAEAETAKRRGAVAMPRPLCRLMRRWARQGGTLVCGIGSPKTAQKSWAAAREAAGIEPARLHDLKHTAVTWAFQRGMTLEGAASYFSTSQQTLERVYRHHSPLYQRLESEIMGRRAATPKLEGKL